MTDDLTAARERHRDCTSDECVCLPMRLYGDDCDVARFRDALDAVQAVFMRLQEFCEASEPGLLDAFWFTEHNRSTGGAGRCRADRRRRK